MISKEYDNLCLREHIMAKKLCFSSAVVTFNPMIFICSMNSPKSRPIDLKNFTDSQMLEIQEYLKSYTERPYVIDAKGEMYVIIPSIYPTSSMSIFLRIDEPADMFLRFFKERPEIFVLSHNISVQPARKSKRLLSYQKQFLDFCTDIEKAFLGMDRCALVFDEADLKAVYCKEVIALSKFLAVPVDKLIVNDAEDGVMINTNFSLFIAFTSCMMMLAKNYALDRHIRVELDFKGGTLTVRTSVKAENKIKITNETFLWEYLAADKKMLYEFYDENGRFCINFRPYFIDWAYLGLKQELNKDLFSKE